MSIGSLTTQPIWTAAGWTMLHLLWVGAVIGAAAAVGRRVTRRARAELRYALGFLCLLAMVMASVVVFTYIYSINRRSDTASGFSSGLGATANSGTVAVKISSRGLDERTGTLREAQVTPATEFGWKLEGVVPWLPWFWVIGAPIQLGLFVLGLAGVEQLRRSSSRNGTGAVLERCRTLSDSMGIVRRVGVAVSDRIVAPILVGIVRPMILLPPAALSGWSADELQMALLHELAHLKRWDNLVNLLQRLVESLLFFHPAVWWISSWIRLERELCCDALVVSRMGCGEAYVEMLLTIGAGRDRKTRGVAAIGMAERQITTRVRRILKMEERTMRLTMPEGLGLAGAVLVGVTLVLGTQAGPPKVAGEKNEALRQTLRKTVADVSASAANDKGNGALPMTTLLCLGQAQLELGDRASAAETMAKALELLSRSELESFGEIGIEWVGFLSEIAKQQREAGDTAAARAWLDRVTAWAESLRPKPVFEELIILTGVSDPRRQKFEMSALIHGEIFTMIAGERIALGDRDVALALLKRAVAAVQPQSDELKAMVLGQIGVMMFKAGDAVGGRQVIDQARAAAGKLTDTGLRAGASTYVAKAMAEIGDLEGAIALATSLDKHGRRSAMRDIVEAMAERRGGKTWFDPEGRHIPIGADSLVLKDAKAARISLPKIADAVRRINDPPLQAQVLSMVAHLQAKAGDFPGARATLDSMPAVRRQDFPSDNNAFCEATRPVSYLLVAKERHDAGDKAGAAELVDRAAALIGEIESGVDRVIGQMVLTRYRMKFGDAEEGRRQLMLGVALANAQPEPLRSRALEMFSEIQVSAGDLAGAARTMSAIRDYPPFEKMGVLKEMAEWYKKSGDKAAMKAKLSEALRLIEAKVPENAAARTGKVRPMMVSSARLSGDLEYEFEPRWTEMVKQRNATSLRLQLGTTEESLRFARTLPNSEREEWLESLAAQLAAEGDVREALRVAFMCESAEQRMMAIGRVTTSITER